MSEALSTTTVNSYIGRDNAVTVVPYSDYSARTNYDLTSATRITADADLTTSTSSGDAIQGDSDVQVSGNDVVTWDDDDGEWRIRCKVGLFSGIAAGTYSLRITIYDAANTNGFVLPDTEETLRVEVVALP